jgi:hypothetical protein
MMQADLLPNGAGHYSAWSEQPPAGTAWQYMSDSSDATGIAASGGEAHSFAMQTLLEAGKGGGAVTGASAYIRAQGSSIPIVKLGWRIGSTDYLSGNVAVPDGGVYGWVYGAPSIAPNSWSGSWDSIEWLVLQIQGDITATEAVGRVTYNPAPGGRFRGIIHRAFGILVAVGLAEMPLLARECYRRTRVLIEPHELEAAWRELREDRWRVYGC